MNNQSKKLPKDIELLLILLDEKIGFLEDSVDSQLTGVDDWLEKFDSLHIREERIIKRLVEQGYRK